MGTRSTVTRESRSSRRDRDQEIARRYHAGETLEQLAGSYGICPSRVSRVLAQLGARLSSEQIRERRRTSGAGRKAVWPDCPPYLRREYLRIRTVIGSVAARNQLLALDARQHHTTRKANS